MSRKSEYITYAPKTSFSQFNFNQMLAFVHQSFVE